MASNLVDLHNNGRCGQHQTIDQARHGYEQLINREIRQAEVAKMRQKILRAQIACPCCDTVVCTTKCHMCGYQPIDLERAKDIIKDMPDLESVSAAESEIDRMSNRSSRMSVHSSASVNSKREKAMQSAKAAAEAHQAKAKKSKILHKKLDNLGEMLEQEREGQQQIRSQIEHIKQLVLQSVEQKQSKSR